MYNITIKDNVIERHVGENAHPVMNSEMFIRFASARLNAAKALAKDGMSKAELETLEQKLGNIFKQSDFIEFEKAKRQRTEELNEAKAALKNGAITPREYRQWCSNTEKEYQKVFDKVYQENIAKMRQIYLLLAHYVDAKKSPDKVIKIINQKADDLRAQTLRPTQHNHYEAAGLSVVSSHIPEGWLTPEQKELYQQVHGKAPNPDNPYTNPSTIRDKRQVGQANALRTEVVINGKEYFVGHRHGSPSVLKMNNDAQRQHRTLQNVKQTLSLAAEEKFKKLSDTDRQKILSGEALDVDMATMSLLSPVMKGDLLDGMKQYRQVDDSRLAYWSLQGRKIPLTIMDKNNHLITIQVKLNSTFMSIGVNAARGVGAPGMGSKELVQRVNNRGINQLTDSFLRNFQGNLPVELILIRKRIDEIENTPAIKQCKQNLTYFENSHERSKLNQAYESLELCNRALDHPEHSTANVKRIKSERAKALKTINVQEAKLDKLYKDLAKARQDAYGPKLKDLSEVLDKMQHANGYQDDKNFQKIRIFIDALDIYYNQPQPGLKRFLAVRDKSNERKKILKKLEKTDDLIQKQALLEKADKLQDEIDFLNKSNYRFQARFAVLAAHMDQFIEWFCKSGEDRTGLLNEHIEAFCIFIEKYHYAPRWDNEDDKRLFHEIMPQVHNGAPNRETNGFNDDGPGLKITDKDFEMPTVSYETDKKMANILKNSGSIYGLKDKMKQFLGKLFGQDALANQVNQAKSGFAQITAEQPKEVKPPKKVHFQDPIAVEDALEKRKSLKWEERSSKSTNEKVLNEDKSPSLPKRPKGKAF